jgi:hypothetical protein
VKLLKHFYCAKNDDELALARRLGEAADDEIKAELVSAHWQLTGRGIELEAKDLIRERIGRSPGKGDPVVMAWSERTKAVERALPRNRPLEVQGIDNYNPHNW